MAYVLIVTTPAPRSVEIRYQINAEHGPAILFRVSGILHHIDPSLSREERLRVAAQVMRHGQERTLVHGPTGHQFRVELADTAGMVLLPEIPAQAGV